MSLDMGHDSIELLTLNSQSDLQVALTDHPVSRSRRRTPAFSFHSFSLLSILVQVLDQFHTSFSLATSKPPNNKVSGKVKGRIVNNMQNGGLGCSPSPPGHDQGIKKVSSERGCRGMDASKSRSVSISNSNLNTLLYLSPIRFHRSD